MLVTCQGHLQSERSAEVDCQFQKRLCIFFIITSGRIWGSCSTCERILIFENILPYGITQVAGLTNAAKGSRSVWGVLGRIGSLAGSEGAGPAHVLLSWQPLENMKLSKRWSSAFSLMRCSSKESTSRSLCSITCIISANISRSSFRSFSSFWLSKEREKEKHRTSGKIWPRESAWPLHSWLSRTCSAL